ncbi:MAG: Wzy polymerase domain-containing protein, partial [Pseudohongiellaceae bacterium]
QFQGSEKEVTTFASLRLIHMPQTIDMILAEPLTGYGYGKFERGFVAYTAEGYARGEITIPGIGGLDHPHNELMLWAAEGGIVALAGVLLAAWFVWSLVMKLPMAHRLAVIGLFFPIVLHTQLEYPFYTSVPHWITFVLLIYWLDSLVSPVKSVQAEQGLLFGTGGVLIPLVTTAFMMTTLQSGYLLARYEFGLEQDVRSLQRMLNPVVWIDRVLLAINFRLVLQGVTSQDPALAQVFIDWSPAFLDRYPRPMHYRYLMMAYQVTGAADDAIATRDRAKYLFPGESFELVDIEQLAQIRILRRPQ